MGCTIGVIQGDTRSLDNGSHVGVGGLFRVQGFGFRD